MYRIQMITFILTGLLVTILFSNLVMKDSKKWKLYLSFYILSIFCIGFFFTEWGTDLNTYFNILEYLKGMNFSSANEYLSNIYKDNLYFRNFVFWAIANSFSIHLLPAISTSSVYGIYAYITCDYCIRKKLTKYMGIILVVQYMFLPLQSIVGNVRNIWAFSLIILATYRDVIQHKRNIVTILLYILPCYLHTSGVLVLLLRVISSIRKFKPIWFILVLFLSPIINVLYNNKTMFPNLIADSINTAYNYLHDIGGINVYSTSIFTSLQKILMFTVSLLFIALILSFRSRLSKDEEIFTYFNFLLFVFVLACNIFVSAHYWRFFCAGIISANVIEAMCCANYSNLKFIYKSIFSLTMVFSVVMFLFNMIMIFKQ